MHDILQDPFFYTDGWRTALTKGRKRIAGSEMFAHVRRDESLNLREDLSYFRVCEQHSQMLREYSQPDPEEPLKVDTRAIEVYLPFPAHYHELETRTPLLLTAGDGRVDLHYSDFYMPRRIQRGPAGNMSYVVALPTEFVITAMSLKQSFTQTLRGATWTQAGSHLGFTKAMGVIAHLLMEDDPLPGPVLPSPVASSNWRLGCSQDWWKRAVFAVGSARS